MTDVGVPVNARPLRTGRLVLSLFGITTASIAFLIAVVESWSLGFHRPLFANSPLIRSVVSFSLLVTFLGIERAGRLRIRGAKPAFLGISIIVLSSVGLALGHPYAILAFALGIASLSAVGFAYRIPAVTISQLVCLALHFVAHYYRSGELVAYLYLLCGVLIIVVTYFALVAVREWERQAIIYEQAKWASVEVARANARLQDQRNRAEVYSRANERLRLAREIHDAVGHTLTAVLVQIDALRADIARNPGNLPLRLDNLEVIVRQAIIEVRHEVSRLRETAIRPESWRTRWLTLCTTFSDSTGVRVSTSVEPQLRDVDDQIGETFYRIIQESLTNAFRHGRATMVDIAGGARDGRLVFRISDNGNGALSIVPGNGLTGMRERIESLDGEISFRTLPGKGFDIGIVLPGRKGAPI